MEEDNTPVDDSKKTPECEKSAKQTKLQEVIDVKLIESSKIVFDEISNKHKLNERKLQEVTDVKLIESSEIIFDEISSKHKLNERKLRKLIKKSVLICQNSTELVEMFKADLIKELDCHVDEYKKLDVYQDVSKKLDDEISSAINDIQHMNYNIGESLFVDNIKDLSENIKSTKQFLEESKDKIDNIYKRIKNAK